MLGSDPQVGRVEEVSTITQLELSDSPLKAVVLKPAKTWPEGAGPSHVVPPSQPPNVIRPGSPGGNAIDRISIGRPVCLPINHATSRRRWRDPPGEEGLDVLAACNHLQFPGRSFLAFDKEPMETAWLETTLSTVRPSGGARPVTWSMEPSVLDDAVEPYAANHEPQQERTD